MLAELSLTEILLFVGGSLFSIIGFFLREQHGRLNKVEEGLQNHRVEDAQNLVSRQEISALRDDIRGMISPIHSKIENIENFLRDNKH